MIVLGDFLGEVCKIIFPITDEVYLGNPKSSISICTLSSISLLKNIASSDLMKEINLVGRLLSENKGIDSIVRYVNSNETIKTLIVCGKEVFGHRAGISLLDLYNNGITNNGKIINSSSPDPTLTVTQNEVKKFRNKVRIINKIGETNLEEITKLVKSIKN